MKPMPHSASPTFRLAAFLLALPACALLQAQDAPEAATEELFSLAEEAGGWVRRTYEDGEAADTPLDRVAAEATGIDAAAVRLPIDLPTRGEFVLPVSETWHGWTQLEMEFVLPEGLPKSTVLSIFTKDHDNLWRQIRMRAPREHGTRVTVTVPIAGDVAAATWVPKRHGCPWHALTPGHIVEVGCAFDVDTGADDVFSGDVLLSAARLAAPGRPDGTPAIRNLGFSPRVPFVGECVEFSFDLHRWYDDPFDPKKLRVSALITRPSGTTESITGFYYEPFSYNPEVRDKTQTLTPTGRPSFRARYCPREIGMHRVAISIELNGEPQQLPALEFRSRAPRDGYRGFVRRDPTDPRFLAWEDGTPFWAVGINVRSPYDNRYMKVAPYSRWINEGLPLYERLFAKYEEVGIDLVEVWMSSWWLALEWINDSPGFHGVGHYNQYRAWMLDHIMKLAEKHGIYVILVLNNHGKFGSTPYDPEWPRNPYNVKNGGYMTSCEEYFSSPRAKADFKRLADYIVARWGYSTHLLSWKLFTEIDLTGNSLTFYKEPVMAAWHKEMGAYLKQIDPYDHPITTHWMLGYYRINPEVGKLPELDLLTTDAYYSSGGTRKLLEMLRGGAEFAREHRKPLLITEFGGSPYGDSMGNFIKQAHLGIWTGLFHEAPATPMYWWFALVDEKDLYGRYSSLRAFSRGLEDRRDLASSAEELEDRGLFLNEMRGTGQVHVWGFDTAYYFSPTENLRPATHADFVWKTKAPAPGDYDVQIWDVAEGAVRETRRLTVTDGQSAIEIPIPPFVLDFAVKVLPAEK